MADELSGKAFIASLGNKASLNGFIASFKEALETKETLEAQVQLIQQVVTEESAALSQSLLPIVATICRQKSLTTDSTTDLYNQLFLLIVYSCSASPTQHYSEKKNYSFLGEHLEKTLKNGHREWQLQVIKALLCNNPAILLAIISAALRGEISQSLIFLPTTAEFSTAVTAGIFSKRQSILTDFLTRAGKSAYVFPSNKCFEDLLKVKETSGELWLDILLARLSARLGFPYGGNDGDRVYVNDWSVKSNLRESKRQKLKQEESQLNGMIKLIFEQKQLKAPGLIYFLTSDISSENYVYLSCGLQASRKSDVEIEDSMSTLFSVERRSLLPPKSPMEAGYFLNYMERQVDDLHDRNERGHLLDKTRMFLRRFAEPTWYVWEKREASNDDKGLEIFVPTMARFFEIVTDHMVAGASYLTVKVAFELLYVWSNSIMELDEPFKRDAGNRLLKCFAPHIVEKLIKGLGSLWEDVRRMSVTLLQRHFSFEEILLLHDGNDSVTEIVRNYHSMLSSPKVRDNDHAVNFFVLVNSALSKDDKPNQQLIQALQSLFCSGHSDESWMSILEKYLLREVQHKSMPFVHGHLAVFKDLIEKRNHLLTLIEFEQIHKSICMPLVHQMLSLIALGENKILLSKAIANPEGSVGSLRIDCRGHLVLGDEHGGVLAGPENEPALAHASAFTRFWLTVKACGDLLTTLFTAVNLANTQEMGCEIVEEAMHDCLEVLLGSRHPGLLERWGTALNTGVRRCAEITELKHIPSAVLSNLMKSITPEKMALLGGRETDDLCIATIETHHKGDLLKHLENASKLFDEEGEKRCLVVPPPLRKSASLCQTFVSLLDGQIFKPNRKLSFYSRLGAKIDAQELAYAIISKLRILSSFIIESNPSDKDSTWKTEAIAASKFHALNLLRAILAQRPTLALAASLQYAKVHNTDPSTAELTLYLELLSEVTVVLGENQDDFRIPSAANQLFTLLQDLTANSSILRTIVADPAMHCDFLSPNVIVFKQRSQHPLAREMHKLYSLSPQLMAKRSQQHGALLNFSTLLTPNLLPPERILRVISEHSEVSTIDAEEFQESILKAAFHLAEITHDDYQRNLAVGLLAAATEQSSLETSFLEDLRGALQGYYSAGKSRILGMWLRSIIREAPDIVDKLGLSQLIIDQVFKCLDHEYNLSALEWLGAMDEALIKCSHYKLWTTEQFGALQKKLLKSPVAALKIVFASRILISERWEKLRSVSSPVQEVFSLIAGELLPIRSELGDQALEETFARLAAFLRNISHGSSSNIDGESIKKFSDFIVQSERSIVQERAIDVFLELKRLSGIPDQYILRLPNHTNQSSAAKALHLAVTGVHLFRSLSGKRLEETVADVVSLVLPEEDIEIRRIGSDILHELMALDDASEELPRCLASVKFLLMTDENHVIRRRFRLGKTLVEAIEDFFNDLILTRKQKFEVIWTLIGGVFQEGKRNLCDLKLPSISLDLVRCLQERTGLLYDEESGSVYYSADGTFDDECDNSLSNDALIIKRMHERIHDYMDGLTEEEKRSLKSAVVEEIFPDWISDPKIISRAHNDLTASSIDGMLLRIQIMSLIR